MLVKVLKLKISSGDNDDDGIENFLVFCPGPPLAELIFKGEVRRFFFIGSKFLSALN